MEAIIVTVNTSEILNKVYNAFNSNMIIVVCGGLKASNIPESHAMKHYLVQKGINPKYIIEEPHSLDDIEAKINAYDELTEFIREEPTTDFFENKSETNSLNKSSSEIDSLNKSDPIFNSLNNSLNNSSDNKPITKITKYKIFISSGVEVSESLNVEMYNLEQYRNLKPKRLINNLYAKKGLFGKLYYSPPVISFHFNSLPLDTMLH